jgi:hypothetical protein
LFHLASKLKTYDAVYGPILVAGDRATGKKSERDGEEGFMWGTFGIYVREDKELNLKWSLKDSIDKKTGEFHEAAITKAKRAFILECRAEGKNEEYIRSLIWFKFDRRRGYTPAVICEDTGKVLESPKSTKDAQWLLERSAALKDLNLTGGQKFVINEMINRVLHRIRISGNSMDKDAKIASTILWHDLQEVETLDDLKYYESQAENGRKFIYKQYITYQQTNEEGHIIEIKTESEAKEHNEALAGTDYEDQMFIPRKDNRIRKHTVQGAVCDFEPSLIDRLSIRGEETWRKHVALKRHELHKAKEKA